MHARKLAATLQRNSKSSRPIMLYVEQTSSATGASGVGQDLETLAEQLTFIMGQTGLTYPPGE